MNEFCSSSRKIRYTLPESHDESATKNSLETAPDPPTETPTVMRSAAKASQTAQSYWQGVLHPPRPARLLLSFLMLAAVILLARTSPPRPFSLENASPFAWQGLRYTWEPGPYRGFDHI